MYVFCIDRICFRIIYSICIFFPNLLKTRQTHSQIHRMSGKNKIMHFRRPTIVQFECENVRLNGSGRSPNIYADGQALCCEDTNKNLALVVCQQFYVIRVFAIQEVP